MNPTLPKISDTLAGGISDSHQGGPEEAKGSREGEEQMRKRRRLTMKNFWLAGGTGDSHQGGSKDAEGT